MYNIVVILIGIFLNFMIERFAKESWVIKSTHEKSLKMALSMIDESQQEQFVIQRDGTILYVNKKGFEMMKN